VFRNIAYILHDQEGQAIEANYVLNEHFDNYNSSVPTLDTPTDEQASVGAGDSNIGDLQFFGKTAPACPGIDDHESFDQHLSVTVGIAPNTKTYPLTMINHVSRGFFDGTAKVDVTIAHP
jgi:hypothetical protein